MYFDPGPDGEVDHRPLLLIHSVNAAASAFEVKPLFYYYRGRRPMYALDLPCFGQSDRSDRFYRTMTDASLLVLSEIGIMTPLLTPLRCRFPANFLPSRNRRG